MVVEPSRFSRLVLNSGVVLFVKVERKVRRKMDIELCKKLLKASLLVVVAYVLVVRAKISHNGESVQVKGSEDKSFVRIKIAQYVFDIKSYYMYRTTVSKARFLWETESDFRTPRLSGCDPCGIRNKDLGLESRKHLTL